MIREVLPAALFSLTIAALVTAFAMPLVNYIVDTICKLYKGEK